MPFLILRDTVEHPWVLGAEYWLVPASACIKEELGTEIILDVGGAPNLRTGVPIRER